MSLTLTTWANLAKRLKNEDRLEKYASPDTSSAHPNTTAAILQVGDMFRSALINRYSEASVDALTATAIEGTELQIHVESIVLDLLTSGDEIQPESILRAGDRAREYLRFIVSGRAHIDGLEELGGAASGSARVRYRSARRIYDRDNSDGGYDLRNQKI